MIVTLEPKAPRSQFTYLDILYRFPVSNFNALTFLIYLIWTASSHMYCHLQVGFITALWLFYSTLCFLPLLLCSIFFFSLQVFYISYFSRISLVYSNNPGASAPYQLEILLFWEAASHEPLLLPLPGCCIDGVLMNACYWLEPWAGHL